MSKVIQFDICYVRRKLSVGLETDLLYPQFERHTLRLHYRDGGPPGLFRLHVSTRTISDHWYLAAYIGSEWACRLLRRNIWGKLKNED